MTAEPLARRCPVELNMDSPSSPTPSHDYVCSGIDRVRWQGAGGQAVLCRRTCLTSSAHPSWKAESVGEREVRKSKSTIEVQVDSGTPFIAPAAPDGEPDRHRLRHCGDGGRGGGAAARGRHLHRLPRRLPDSCVTNLGTDEQVMNGKSTASVECQNFNVQICKNRFSLTRCHAQ